MGSCDFEQRKMVEYQRDGLDSSFDNMSVKLKSLENRSEEGVERSSQCFYNFALSCKCLR